MDRWIRLFVLFDLSTMMHTFRWIFYLRHNCHSTATVVTVWCHSGDTVYVIRWIFVNCYVGRGIWHICVKQTTDSTQKPLCGTKKLHPNTKKYKKWKSSWIFSVALIKIITSKEKKAKMKPKTTQKPQEKITFFDQRLYALLLKGTRSLRAVTGCLLNLR